MGFEALISWRSESPNKRKVHFRYSQQDLENRIFQISYNASVTKPRVRTLPAKLDLKMFAQFAYSQSGN